MEIKFSNYEELPGFYIVNLPSVQQKYQQWIQHLPKIKPYYAVKCNPDTKILKTLADLGANFDCASQAEIETVLNLEVDASRIIFAHPTKLVSHLKFAKQKGVSLMTFDNVDELTKISKHYPDAKLVLRISTDDRGALCQFSSKYGARSSEYTQLLEHGSSLGLNIVGVSFHIGSGSQDSQAFPKAISEAANVFNLAKSYGYTLKLLDIGGGFLGSYTSSAFATVAAKILESIESLATFDADTQIIAEPGRYFVTESQTLYLAIISRRRLLCDEEVKFIYYVSDGVYHSFNCIFFDHAQPQVELIYPAGAKCRGEDSDSDSDRDSSASNANRYSSTIFGPTCDALDRICKDVQIPELEVGDWICFKNMGAYTTAAASSFNGFPLPQRFYIE